MSLAFYAQAHTEEYAAKAVCELRGEQGNARTAHRGNLPWPDERIKGNECSVYIDEVES